MEENEVFESNEYKGVSDIYREYAEKAAVIDELEMLDSKEDETSLDAIDIEDSLENTVSKIGEESEDKDDSAPYEEKIEDDKTTLSDEKNEEDSIEEGNEFDEISDKLNNVLDDANDEKEKKLNSNKQNLVTFKGSKRGIEIYLSDDESVTFEEILDNLNERIERTKDVFKDVRCGIVIKGRRLEKKEEEKIVLTLRRNMNISIDYINMHEFFSNENVKKDKNDSRKDYSETMFYHGTLRSGQSLTNNASIVIFGDVNPGSEVIAGGNLIVMGSLRGIVQAGQRSNDAYIVAFDMNPKQLRIGDYIARAADEGDDERIKKPHKAYIVDDQICIEPIEGTFNLIEKEV